MGSAALAFVVTLFAGLYALLRKEQREMEEKEKTQKPVYFAEDGTIFKPRI